MKTNIDRLFDKNLTDLVRGLRNNKDNEVPEFSNVINSINYLQLTILFQASYIANCLEEIKQELKLDNINVKCNAVSKLTYVNITYLSIYSENKQIIINLLCTAPNVWL